MCSYGKAITIHSDENTFLFVYLRLRFFFFHYFFKLWRRTNSPAHKPLCNCTYTVSWAGFTDTHTREQEQQRQQLCKSLGESTSVRLAQCRVTVCWQQMFSLRATSWVTAYGGRCGGKRTNSLLLLLLSVILCFPCKLIFLSPPSLPPSLSFSSAVRLENAAAS